ncbi:MAG: tetratricopeptide repeat protein [Alphaproteobacteria bacterium]|nr:tetratricopeptide repeat protein [Alphaproteobacteria bacterium]
MAWRLKLFGQFDLTGPQGPVSLSSAKLSALLAILARAARPVQREHLTAMLWGSHFDDQARQNFRQALVRLRKIVGADVLLSNDATVHLALTEVESDVGTFEHLASAGTPEALRSAAQLIDGEFLAGLHIAEPQFEDWLTGERRRLGEQACNVLARLAAEDLARGDAAQALRHAEACVARDYFREDAHRTLMQALTLLGRRAEAVRHHQDFAARLRYELQTAPQEETTRVFERLRKGTDLPAPSAAPAASGTGKPSIAVLPFANLSNDSEQDFFADGISEDLIAEISKFRSLFVISRNSSFSFKGETVGLRDIAAKLGARYVVDGSVRKAGDRLRITAKLVDAGDDKTLWADHYDRNTEDIFAVQDEVVHAIVSTIEPQLLTNERNRALRKPPDSLDAWEAYQRGLWQLFRYRREDRDQAIALFRTSIARDPRFASAHAGLALALYVYVLLGSSPHRDEDLCQGVAAAETAIDLDEYDPLGYAALARCYIMLKRPQDALTASDRAIRFNPSFAMAHFARGHSLWHQGRPAEAIPSIDEAMRLSPRDPTLWAFMASRAIALALSGEEEQATEWSRRAQQQTNAAIFAHVGELLGWGLLGRTEEAANAVARAQATMPDVSVSFLDRVLPITDTASRERFLAGLRKSGLPA